MKNILILKKNVNPILLKLFLIFIGFSINISSLNAQLHFTNYASQNLVTCLAEDGSNIWIGTLGGLLKRSKTGALISVYTTSNSSLPNNAIVDIAVDDMGNKWLATYGSGLVKFDGSTWTVFNTENSNILSDNIYNFKTDLQGKKWINTEAGVSVFDGQSFTNYDTSNTPMDDYFVNYVAIDNEGKKWFSSYNKIFSLEGNTWTVWDTTNINIPNVFNSIQEVLVDNQNNKWFLAEEYNWTQGSNYFIMKYDNQSWTVYDSISFGTTINNWMGIKMASDGSILVGASYPRGGHGCGIFRFDGNSWQMYHDSTSIPVEAYILLVDAEGNEWYGANGLYKYNGTSWDNYFTQGSMSSNDLTGICTDNQNNIWASSFSGVIKFNGLNFTNYNTGNSNLIDDEIYNIFCDSQNRIWCGTPLKGCQMFDGTQWSTFDTLNSTMTNMHVLCVAEDPAGHIWVGTENYNQSNRIAILDGNTWSYLDLPINTWGVYAIKFKSGKTYIASANGLLIYDGSTWTSYGPDNGYTMLQDIETMTFDTDGILWVGFNSYTESMSGLASYDDTQWTYYTSETHNILNETIRSITTDNYGNLWIGYYDSGICKFNGTDAVFYDMSNSGICFNNIAQIVIVSDNSKWIATGNGLSHATCQNPVAAMNIFPTCLPDSTYMESISTGIDDFTRYEWDVQNNGIIDGTGEDFVYQFSATGAYPVKLIVSNDNCADTILQSTIVGIQPQVYLEPETSVNFCSGTTTPVEVIIENYNDQLPYSYQWSNGETTSLINASESGQYFVTVSVNNCYSISDTVLAHSVLPDSTQEICMVLVDQGTGKNLIIWQKIISDNISAYNIYKEIAANHYDPIGNVSYNMPGVFLDNSSAPQVMSNRYKISVVDTCGNESPLSAFHKTVHLNVSPSLPSGFALTWDHYFGFSFGIYRIYRGNSNGQLVQIDSVPFNLATYTYTDQTPPPGTLYYMVTAVKPDAACDPSSNKEMTGPFSQSLSNIEDNGIIEANPGYIEKFSGEEIQIVIAPNPLHKTTTLSFENDNHSKYSIRIINQIGCMVLQKENITDNNILLNRNDLKSGVYTILLEGEKVLRAKLVVD